MNSLETQKCRNYASEKSSCITLLKSVVSTLLKSVVGANAYAALWNGYTFEKCSANYAFQSIGTKLLLFQWSLVPVTHCSTAALQPYSQPSARNDSRDLIGRRKWIEFNLCWRVSQWKKSRENNIEPIHIKTLSKDRSKDVLSISFQCTQRKAWLVQLKI